ncbi:MAG TPA: hypothetical protein VMJ12_02725, partial [Candidatus Acidoferrales bacterium]|nr:hypothetical protein [Candidatus Acidoferrales bacterium]
MTEINNKLKVWDNFQALVGEVHKEAETAARKKQTDKLFEATDWLRRAQELETRHLELTSHADKLTLEWNSPIDEKQIIEGHISFQPSVNGMSSSNDTGGKQRAGECRGAYLDRERKRGNPLKRLRGSYFKNAVGLT